MHRIAQSHVQLLVRDAKGRFAAATPDVILEKARQVIDQRMQRGQKLESSQATSEFLQVKLSGFEHEVFAILLLDNQHRLIAYTELSHGTLDRATVHPREVVKEALKHNAGAVILAHNHPSGDLKPSRADREITNRLVSALALIDVRVLDHVIVSGLKTFSFAQKGLV